MTTAVASTIQYLLSSFHLCHSLLRPHPPHLCHRQHRLLSLSALYRFQGTQRGTSHNCCGKLSTFSSSFVSTRLVQTTSKFLLHYIPPDYILHMFRILTPLNSLPQVLKLLRLYQLTSLHPHCIAAPPSHLNILYRLFCS